MNKYDVHTHILPGIDDGARDLAASLALIKKLVSQGVTHIALTPHYYSSRQSKEDFLSNRNSSAKKLMPEISDKIKLTLGAEVYVTDYIFNNTTLKDVCYDGTDFMLTEFPYSADFAGKAGDTLYRLMSSFGIKPVMAHIERYDSLINDPELVEELRELGCLMQINLDSLTHFGTRRKIIKLIKNGSVDLLGTDTHSFKKGSEFNIGFDFLQKKFGNSLIEEIENNSLQLFK